MTFSETPPCSGSSPRNEDYACPPSPTTPTLRTQAITLTMGTTTYNGTLRTDLQDRIDRLNTLLTGVYRVLLSFQGGVGWRRISQVDYSDPFQVDDDRESDIMDKRGFDAIMEYLYALNKKIDYLHSDLAAIEPVGSIPEHWQMKRESKRAQAIMLFGELKEDGETIGPPKWQVAVPHVDVSFLDGWTNRFGWRKGGKQGMATLSDNSKIIIYAHDEEEIENVFDAILPRIPSIYREGIYYKFGDYKQPDFKDIEVRLRRIDWYSEGLVRAAPDAFRRFRRFLDPA